DAFPQPLDRRVKNGCDDTDEWLERESKRLLPHSIQVAWGQPVALYPLVIFARARGIFGRSESKQLLPNRLGRSFKKAIRREQHTTYLAFRRFQQRLLLLLQQS